MGSDLQGHPPCCRLFELLNPSLQPSDRPLESGNSGLVITAYVRAVVRAGPHEFRRTAKGT